jgi:hypothetical protein
MKDEDEIQVMADRANDYANGKRLNAKGPAVDRRFAEGVAAALDWVLGEDDDVIDPL